MRGEMLAKCQQELLFSPSRRGPMERLRSYFSKSHFDSSFSGFAAIVAQSPI